MKTRERQIDLNADLGEGAANDSALLAWVTSANLACGGHAGDAETMRVAVAAAATARVGVGAHPSFEDRTGFGRRDLPLTPAGARELILRQVGALQEVARRLGVAVVHVKPHGALYNRSTWDTPLAEAIAAAVYEINPGLILFGFAGGALIRAGAARGLVVANEVFADRTYLPDGTLTPRSQPGALIGDQAEALQQVLRMVREGKVRAPGGGDLPVRADTVCVHGDGAQAVAIARILRTGLTAAGFRLARPNADREN